MAAQLRVFKPLSYLLGTLAGGIAAKKMLNKMNREEKPRPQPKVITEFEVNASMASSVGKLIMCAYVFIPTSIVVGSFSRLILFRYEGAYLFISSLVSHALAPASGVIIGFYSDIILYNLGLYAQNNNRLVRSMEIVMTLISATAVGTVFDMINYSIIDFITRMRSPK